MDNQTRIGTFAAYVFTLGLLSVSHSFSQSISIGGDELTYFDSSAALQLHSTSQGLLIPSMTNQQLNDITAPAEGLQVYDLTDSMMMIFDGVDWVRDYQVKRRKEFEIHPEVFDISVLSDFPGEGRDRSMSFKVDDTAYVVGGRGANINGQINYLNDAFKLDLNSSTWQSITDMPGPGQYDGVGFSIGGIGYAGGGNAASNFNKSSIYAYNTQSGSWDSISPYPLPFASEVSLSFVVNGIPYVGTESYLTPTIFNRYNIIEDTWTPIAPYPGDPRRKAVTFVMKDLGCVGSGDSQNRRDFYCYDPIDNCWDTIASLPVFFSGHTLAFVIDSVPYVGIDTVMYRYESEADIWHRVDYRGHNFGGGGVAFEHEDNAYFTIGSVTLNHMFSYNSQTTRLGLTKYFLTNNSYDVITWSNIPNYLTIDTMTAVTEGGLTLVTTGLSRDQIIDLSLTLDAYGDGGLYPPNYNRELEVEYDYWLKPDGNIAVINSTNNSAAILGKPLRIQITYRDE